MSYFQKLCLGLMELAGREDSVRPTGVRQCSSASCMVWKVIGPVVRASATIWFIQLRGRRYLVMNTDTLEASSTFKAAIVVAAGGIGLRKNNNK